MMIKNIYLPNNGEYYINRILKELCKKNISYTYIKESSELHFDKYIIRFVYQNVFDLLKTSSDFDSLLYDIFDIAHINELNLINEPVEIIKYDSNSIKSMSKKELKILNRMLNKQIKNNNIIVSKSLKKQLNPIRKIYK